METKKNYKQICAELAQLQKQKELYDRLHDVGGISYKQVDIWEHPIIRSGYSMGENINVFVNHNCIASISQTQDYAKSCSYRAHHGTMVFDFTKKDFKHLFALLAARNYHIAMFVSVKSEYKPKYRQLYEAENAEIRELWRKAFIADESEYKGNNMKNVTIG